MSWATILNGIAALLVTLTGLQVDDRVGPAKMTDPKIKARIYFSVTAVQGIGEDDRRVDEDTGVETVCGQRLFTLGVKCESYDQSPNVKAIHYLNLVTTRLARSKSIDTLQGFDTAWIDAHPSVDLPTTYNDRVMSCAQVDLQFLTVINDADTDNPVDFIDSVELASVDMFDPGPEISLTVEAA